jgi:hypothetical protein
MIWRLHDMVWAFGIGYAQAADFTGSDRSLLSFEALHQEQYIVYPEPVSIVSDLSSHS